MDRLEKIRKFKKLNRITWNNLAEKLPIDGNGLRVAFSRNKVDDNYLEIIESTFDLKEKEQNVQVNEHRDSYNEKKYIEDIIAEKVSDVLKENFSKIIMIQEENQKTLSALREQIQELKNIISEK